MEEHIIAICDNYRHLVCYPFTIDNLHTVAKRLNIKRCWYHAGNNPHYDIPKRRKEEIMTQCIVFESKELLNLIRGLRNEAAALQIDKENEKTIKFIARTYTNK